MKVISTVSEIRKQLRDPRPSPVGFVPTMGALHEGHLTLVKNAVSGCSLVVVSIYVNPAQFNDKEDLKRYPRTIDADLTMLQQVLREKDIVFTPDNEEIYPVEDKGVFHFGNLDTVMEAVHRPGHFNGVAQVVSRLFEIVRPDIAFFGQKDFQQVAVIKELVRQTGSGVRIITVPVVREPDGLAMSSRNMFLEPGIRERASVIFRTITAASAMINTFEIAEIKKFVKETIEKTEGFRVEYFEIVDDTFLIPVIRKSKIKTETRYFGCIAVTAGKIRLIDNIEMQLA